MGDEEDIHFIEKQTMSVDDFKCENGWILDIGGGGEGIISQVKGSNVVAIDLKASELREASGDSLKIIMDARDLKFLDNTFKTVTAFFSLMYVKCDEWDKIFKEIFRVLDKGGIFLLWDVNFKAPHETNKNLIGLYLDVTLPNGKLVETGYGTKMHNQSSQDFIDVASKNNLVLSEKKESGETFFLKFIKK